MRARPFSPRVWGWSEGGARIFTGLLNTRGRSARTVSNPRFPQQRSNLPELVRDVLENPSPETARAYVLWSRQASERLSKATEYIAQATREINTQASSSPSSNERRNDLIPTGVGPVGLYYFFSPADQGVAKDVAVLNKIWREGRIGVVGIPVTGNDKEIARFVNEARLLFPVRKSDAEVYLVKPTETPELYLALPLGRSTGSSIFVAVVLVALARLVEEVIGRVRHQRPLADVR
jgi:hypothetical protein